MNGEINKSDNWIKKEVITLQYQVVGIVFWMLLLWAGIFILIGEYLQGDVPGYVFFPAITFMGIIKIIVGSLAISNIIFLDSEAELWIWRLKTGLISEKEILEERDEMGATPIIVIWIFAVVGMIFKYEPFQEGLWFLFVSAPMLFAGIITVVSANCNTRKKGAIYYYAEGKKKQTKKK